MKLVSAMILSLLLLTGVVIAPSHADLVSLTGPVIAYSQAVLVSTDPNVAAKTFSGRIEDIDPLGRIVAVQSEERKGEVRLLAFSDAEVVKGLKKGDRVVIELDERGMATKIVKAEPDMQGTPDLKN